MSVDAAAKGILLVGVGNILLTDDGVGVHIIRELEVRRRRGEISERTALRDGGTIGLALLPEFDDAESLIVIDAIEMGAPPGTVRVFQGPNMDVQLRGKKSTVHEVALADLMAAARLTGSAPERRALVGIQPGSTEWGLYPTDLVCAAIPKACDIVLSLVEEWDDAL
jgi:hydrogenase maturation protease